ncbi:hypothetical protein PhaeoP97_01811 [Phaeobacter porticola]|uniref:Uncharacterized protein n=1 Tax=Phaeobacter porticola TaxID=1844006 RepID=A0A1L3I503_9RHOB|nr:hypothetical protein PhaeoP97_01811 [Phaeobacter porticola]
MQNGGERPGDTKHGRGPKTRILTAVMAVMGGMPECYVIDDEMTVVSKYELLATVTEGRWIAIQS